ncbi:MAG: hypothetical protein K6E62_11290 [Lachnospiraceae bacterium]|nr:hypothetical protein [Lachnospiraceae bacterium]
MKKRVLAYLDTVGKMLENPENVVDWDVQIRKHLTQIGFFMHERLIHLIVTALFAILTFMVLLQLLNDFSAVVAVLFIALMSLLIPYIMHYYLLENSVQKMYEQYDRMVELADNRSKAG